MDERELEFEETPENAVCLFISFRRQKADGGKHNSYFVARLKHITIIINTTDFVAVEVLIRLRGFKIVHSFAVCASGVHKVAKYAHASDLWPLLQIVLPSLESGRQWYDTDIPSKV